MQVPLLHVYLRDHYAASAGGVALAKRAVGSTHPLAEQIARDRLSLERVMRELDVDPNSMKVVGVRLAEWASRLKLNGRIFKRSPLRRVVELETLLVGVRGKEALWTALQKTDVRIDGVDLTALVDSAQRQGADLESLRLKAVAQAFSSPADKTSIRESAA